VRASFGVTPGEIYAIRIGAGGSGGRGEGVGADGEDTATLLDGNVILVARAGCGGGTAQKRRLYAQLTWWFGGFYDGVLD
jgi:hypothetical protein